MHSRTLSNKPIGRARIAIVSGSLNKSSCNYIVQETIASAMHDALS